MIDLTRTPRTTVGVMGAGGGRGCSTLAAALATRAALARHETVLIDLDPGGGGLDVLTGADREPGPRWDDLAGVRGALDAPGLIGRLPRTPEQVSVLSFERRWGRLDDEVREVVVRDLAQAAEVTVVDLGTRGPQVLEQLDALLLLVTGDVGSLAAAQAVTGALAEVGARPWLVARRMGRDLSRHAADRLGLPLLHELPEDPRVHDEVQHGLAPGSGRRSPLAAAADEILHTLLTGQAAA